MLVGCAPQAKPTETPSATAESSYNASYESPGGMWMPKQMASHADTLRRLGLELEPSELADPLSPTLASIVSLGGCSASFVSPEGLVITNHHCVSGSLQYNSTPEENLVEAGYLARTRAEEKWNGPTSRVYVTQAFTDVSERILSGLDQIADDRARFDEIESREKALVAACEKDRPHLRCSVKGYFRGAEYYLIEQLEIRDVRLVYAPPKMVGFYGGDHDNWMWPRHAGDFSFYRAYVGPDGKPADHAAENVPYRPAHHLRLATTPLEKGDLVMVAGYPGTTNRYRTADEVRDTVESLYPYQIEMLEAYLGMLREVSELNEKTALKASTWIFGFENALKNRRGMLDGLVKGGLAEDKAALERELRAWIDAEPARQAEYGQVFDQMRALHDERNQTRDRDRAFNGLGFSQLLGTARLIVRMAEERPKPDSERDPTYQARNWSRHEAGMTRLSHTYDEHIDRGAMALTLRRALAKPEQNRDWLALVFAGKPVTEAGIAALVEHLYGGTKLADEAVRLELFRTATTESLAKNDDPLIALALALRPFEKALEENEKRLDGAFSVLEPRYIAALRAYSDGELAPDANGTLRITYGTVRGYQPTPDAPMYEPFTKLSGVAAKHTGTDPFNAPERVLAAIRAGHTGSYAAASLGEVPVDFLSDVDTTGGNSGSATLNGRGELVGLLFDGNYESMASDWLFIPALTRGIHLDIRYALWMLDAVENADHLLREMGVEPSIEPAPAAMSAR
ncbi:S46 family peptidase [Haliangium sp.]